MESYKPMSPDLESKITTMQQTSPGHYSLAVKHHDTPGKTSSDHGKKIQGSDFS